MSNQLAFGYWVEARSEDGAQGTQGFMREAELADIKSNPDLHITKLVPLYAHPPQALGIPDGLEQAARSFLREWNNWHNEHHSDEQFARVADRFANVLYKMLPAPPASASPSTLGEGARIPADPVTEKILCAALMISGISVESMQKVLEAYNGLRDRRIVDQSLDNAIAAYLSALPPSSAEDMRERAAQDDFKIGDRVEKFTGEARWYGIVVAAYDTTKGKRRFVVDVEPQGFQMIAVASQLRHHYASPKWGTEKRALPIPAKEGDEDRSETPIRPYEQGAAVAKATVPAFREALKSRTAGPQSNGGET